MCQQSSIGAERCLPTAPKQDLNGIDSSVEPTGAWSVFLLRLLANGRTQPQRMKKMGSSTEHPKLLTRLASPFKEFGLLAGALYMLDRLLRTISPNLGLQVYEFMVQPIAGQGHKPLLPPNLARNLSFVEIGRGHPDLAKMPAREDIKLQRFEQGAHCLGAYKKGELIGYLWYCRQRYQEDLVRCTYELVDEERSIFDFDLYVLPQHRLGLAFLGIWHGVNETLGPMGARYTFSRLTRFNTASRRAHAHLGWRRVGSAVFVCAWRMELMFCSLAPYLSLTLSRRVQLRLAPSVLEQGHGSIKK